MARNVIARVPMDTKEANDFLFQIGSLEREMDALEKAHAEEVARLRQAVDEQLAPLSVQHKLLVAGLEVFAKTNRTTLLRGNAKTVTLPAGYFGWKWNPEKVVVKGGVKNAVETIEALAQKDAKWKQYLRVKTTLDRQAIVKDHVVIDGVIRISQTERFIYKVKPEVASEAETNVVNLTAKSA